MENQLKERLVGATVLVLAAVIFIPMVLDGPGSTQRISRSVALPDADASGERTVRIDLDARGLPVADENPGPAPAESRTELASVDLVPLQQQENASVDEPASEDSGSVEQPPTDKPSSPASASIAPWTVQVGSFSRDENAEALAARLRKLDYPAYVSRYDDGSQVHYRVRVGGFPNRDAAQVKAEEIRAKTGEPAGPAPNR